MRKVVLISRRAIGHEETATPGAQGLKAAIVLVVRAADPRAQMEMAKDLPTADAADLAASAAGLAEEEAAAE